MSVLTALGQVLQDHMGYVKGVHYLRLDGGVSDTRMGGGGTRAAGGSCAYLWHFKGAHHTSRRGKGVEGGYVDVLGVSRDWGCRGRKYVLFMAFCGLLNSFGFDCIWNMPWHASVGM
jgi:hypothetical protein